MCGIVGFSGSDNADMLATMSSAIRHRGPDGKGSFLDRQAGVGLAVRRLAIVDVRGGRQPFPDASGRYRLVFNGEIYNAAELRAELLRDGWPLRTSHSDTECLLYLYLAHGHKMLRRLNGMFAFVIYDRVAGELFGARDRIGIKPLYYHWHGGQLAFASELKALLPCPWISRSIDPSALFHYLGLQSVPAPSSIFADVKKLPAGCWFRLDLRQQRFSVERYWSLPLGHTEQRTEAQWRELLRDELKQSVARWSQADGPVGCALSEGIDSAGIVGLLTEVGFGAPRTYSVGFSAAQDLACDELEPAARVARHYRTRHREIRIGPGDLVRDIDAMVEHLDEPYAGGLPSWYLYRAMAQDVKVALTGLGADELFGSYGKYRIFESSRRIRMLWRLRQARRFGLAWYLLPHADVPHGLYFHQFMPDRLKRCLVLSADSMPGTAQLMERGWQASGADNARDAVAWLEFRHQLPEEFLHMTDRFSMAHSVEARTPYLDHQLVEQVFAMPSRLRTADQPYKQTFRASLRDLLPQEVLMSPKRGFILPLRDWTRGPLRALLLDTLNVERLRRQGLFRPHLVQHLVQAHMRSRQDFTRQIWTLFMFQLWYDRFA